MPSTHLSLHYHLVFGTKDHQPLVHKSWRPRLHQYLGGVVATLGGIAEAVGGVSDHVHLLVGLRATHCLADVLREVKSVSSGWVHDELRLPNLRGRKAMAGSLLVLLNERRSEHIFCRKKNIIEPAHFVRSTSSCLGATGWNSTSAMYFDPPPLPGRSFRSRG